MKYDQYGRPFVTSTELADMLYIDPDLPLHHFEVDDPETYNQSIALLHAELPKLKKYSNIGNLSVDEFDAVNQKNWHMPGKYKELDIAKWLLDQCKTETEMQRVGQELIMFQERDLFDLLRYMKYLVDLMREKGIVWGVGRGSSVASYVLYLIGAHKIDSIYYQLDIREFLKDEEIA
jgi:DNA polymerase III alpha subunit